MNMSESEYIKKVYDLLGVERGLHQEALENMTDAYICSELCAIRTRDDEKLRKAYKTIEKLKNEINRR